jgi:tetratricopeptide (TPR) repeat protein
VAQSLWQGRFRAAGRPDLREAADPDGATQLDGVAPPAAGAAGAAAAGSSSLLSDPQRPYAKGVAQIGVQAAEALEYAAGQGVLHRDIKPSNLLLDVWGTVWLTDFGLAKASGTPDLTRTGDVLGTLRYMAPERFQGRADIRSDVYALGLTLYELLALRPAFAAAAQAQLIGQIVSGEPPRLDRLNPQLPRDLVTVVHKAMARDPADRYPTAGALAEDLRRFLDDRPITARRARLGEQAWRWCRRNPTMAGLLAALLALLLVATGGGVWLVRQQAERRAEASRQEQELGQEVGTALAQAVRLRQGFHFGQSRELLEQARQRVQATGPDDLRRRLDQARADLDLAERLDAARLQEATVAARMPDDPDRERRYAAAYGAAFARAGLGREGDDVAAVAARVRASAVRAEIVAGLDDWASVTQDPARRAWLLAVARRADPDPGRDRLRQPRLWRNRAAVTKLAQEANEAALSPQLATALGRALAESGGDSVPLLAAAQARSPQDFLLNFELGWAYYKDKRWDEALGYYRAALALRPQSALAHTNLGFALYVKGRPDEAIGHLQQAIRLNPKNSMAYYNLGFALQAKGRLDEAIGHYQQAVRLDPKNALAHNNLGSCLYAAARDAADLGPQGAPLGERERARRHRQALDWLRAALALRAQLLRQGSPQVYWWSYATWQTDPALASVRDPGALAQLPAAERQQWQRLWANVAALLAADPLEQGRAHAARRDWAQAAACYARALKPRPPDDGHFWFEYAAVRLLAGDRPGYARACARMVERCGKAPNLRAYHVARACTLAPDAVADAARPGRLAQKELQANAGQFWSLTEQGALHYRAGRFQEAVPLFERSLRIEPKPGCAVLNRLWLALAQHRRGRADEARRWLGKAQAWLDGYRAGMPPNAEAKLGLHLHNWLEAHVLRREAEALLGAAPTKPKKPGAAAVPKK